MLKQRHSAPHSPLQHLAALGSSVEHKSVTDLYTCVHIYSRVVVDASGTVLLGTVPCSARCHVYCLVCAS